MGKRQVFEFYFYFNPIFYHFLKIKREQIFYQETSPGLLDNIFLHKPCKFKQNRSSGSREILTTIFKIQFRDKRVQTFYKVFAVETIEKHAYRQIDLYTKILVRF